MDDGNVRAWLEGAPSEVTEGLARLMAEVERLRAAEEVYPAQCDVLRALELTGPREVRAVILGQDPYHEPGQAMGLAFSVPEGQRVPPSLRNVYAEMATDLGCPAPSSGDLTPWAEQGVLLLNATLTVRAHAAGSHAGLGWQALTSYIVRRCFEAPQPVAFLAWGRHALGVVEKAREEALAAGRAGGGPSGAAGSAGGAEPGAGGGRAGTGSAAPTSRDGERGAGLLGAADGSEAGGVRDEGLPGKLVLASTHPSPLSARRAAGGLPAFIGSRPFSRANEFLAAHGSEPVDWARAGRG